MNVCPTCHRKHYTPAPPRVRTCWACGGTFVQEGSGRARLVCTNPECLRERRRYRRKGGASLETYRGEPEDASHVPTRVFQHALGHSRGQR